MDIIEKVPRDVLYNIVEYIQVNFLPNSDVIDKMNTFNNIKLLLISALSCMCKSKFILENDIYVRDEISVLGNHGMYDFLKSKYQHSDNICTKKLILKYNKFCLSILFDVHKDDIISLLRKDKLSTFLFQNRYIDYIVNKYDINVSHTQLMKDERLYFFQNQYSEIAKNMKFDDCNVEPIFHGFLIEQSVCVKYVESITLSFKDYVKMSSNPNMIPILEKTLMSEDVSRHILKTYDWSVMSKYCKTTDFVLKYIDYIENEYLSQNSEMISFLGKHTHLISWDTLILNNPNISEILANEYICSKSQFQLLLLTVTHYSNTTFEELMFLCSIFKMTPLVDICNMVLLQEHCTEKVMSINMEESVIFGNDDRNIFDFLY